MPSTRLALILLEIVAAVSASTNFDCNNPSNGYDLMHGRYYKLAGSSSSYGDAADACQEDGTRLAIIEDPWIYSEIGTAYLGNCLRTY